MERPTEQINFIGVGLTILVIVFLSIFIDIDSLKIWIERVGIWGPLIFILLKISTIVVAPLSGASLYPLAGIIFGFGRGILYVAIGDFVGHSLAFFISRFLGKNIATRFISNKESGLLARIIDHLSKTKGFFQACLIFFTVPEILSYAAGLSRISYFKFISILWPLLTLVTTVLVLFGAILAPRSGSLLIGLALPVIGAVIMIVGGFFFIRGLKDRKAN